MTQEKTKEIIGLSEYVLTFNSFCTYNYLHAQQFENRKKKQKLKRIGYVLYYLMYTKENVHDKFIDRIVEENKISREDIKETIEFIEKVSYEVYLYTNIRGDRDSFSLIERFFCDFGKYKEMEYDADFVTFLEKKFNFDIRTVLDTENKFKISTKKIGTEIEIDKDYLFFIHKNLESINFILNNPLVIAAYYRDNITLYPIRNEYFEENEYCKTKELFTEEPINPCEKCEHFSYIYIKEGYTVSTDEKCKVQNGLGVCSEDSKDIKKWKLTRINNTCDNFKENI